MSESKSTTDQDAIIRRMWTDGTRAEIIVDAVNATGTSYTLKQVQARARKLAVARPPGHQAAALLWAYANGRSPRGGRPTKPPAVAIQVPLRELIRHGREFGLDVARAMDVEAVSRAARKEDHTHPGFAVVRLATRRQFV